MMNLNNTKFIGCSKEDLGIKEINKIILLIHPRNAKLEIRKIEEEYYISPVEGIVGYNFDTDCDQRCFNFGIGRGGQQVGISTKNIGYHFYQIPFSEE